MFVSTTVVSQPPAADDPPRPSPSPAGRDNDPEAQDGDPGNRVEALQAAISVGGATSLSPQAALIALRGAHRQERITRASLRTDERS
jgi:hypothetical protein